MADYKNIPLGLRTQTQIPLDVKEYIQNESLLSNLGVNGQLAYTYTKGLVVYCIEESTRWEWTEVKPGLEDTGLINQDFIYPDNHIAFGIDYSNKRYNFVKVTSGSDQDNIVKQIIIDETTLPLNYSVADVRSALLALPPEDRTILDTNSKVNVIVKFLGT